MNFGCLIAGFILLFNPVINIVDLLPDAIGFLLIMLGLNKISLYVSQIAQARKLFGNLAAVEAVKLVLVFLIVGTEGSSKLLVTLIACIAEALIFIPAVNNLFDGLSFAGMRYGSTVMYEPVQRKEGKNRKSSKSVKASSELITVTRSAIIFMYIFRICATLIPELTELQLYEYLGEVSAFSRSLASYKPLLYILFGILTIIFGIKYIKRVTVFFKKLKNDTLFIDGLNRKYEYDILPRENFFTARRMKLALSFLSASAVTSYVLMLDDINLMVGAISSGLLIASAALMLKYESKTKFVIVIASIRCALAVFNFIKQVYYFAEYSVNDAEHFANATAKFRILKITVRLEYIMALLSFILLLVLMLKVVKAHLATCGIQSSDVMFSKKAHDVEVYNTVGGKILLSSVLAVINFFLAAGYYSIIPKLEYINVINSIVTIVFAVYVIYMVNTINSMLYDKEAEII